MTPNGLYHPSDRWSQEPPNSEPSSSLGDLVPGTDPHTSPTHAGLPADPTQQQSLSDTEDDCFGSLEDLDPSRATNRDSPDCVQGTQPHSEDQTPPFNSPSTRTPETQTPSDDVETELNFDNEIDVSALDTLLIGTVVNPDPSTLSPSPPHGMRARGSTPSRTRCSRPSSNPHTAGRRSARPSLDATVSQAATDSQQRSPSPDLGTNGLNVGSRSARRIRRAQDQPALSTIVGNPDTDTTTTVNVPQPTAHLHLSCPLQHCTYSGDTLVALRTHLASTHSVPGKPLPPSVLAPLGLTTCPYCDTLCQITRGLANHAKGCSQRSVLSLAARLGITDTYSPRCWVWFDNVEDETEGVSHWFPARASPLGEDCPENPLTTLLIHWDDGDEPSYTNVGRISFTDPLVQTPSLATTVPLLAQGLSSSPPAPSGPRPNRSTPAPAPDEVLQEDPESEEEDDSSSLLDHGDLDLSDDPFHRLPGRPSGDFPRHERLPHVLEVRDIALAIYHTGKEVKLKPITEWPEESKRTFANGCNAFSPYFTQMLGVTGDERELATYVLLQDVCALPAKILHQSGGWDRAPASGRPPPDLVTGNTSKISRATALAYTNQWSKAGREFTSNGLATPSIEIAELLRDMHPECDEPLLPEVPAGQVHITDKAGLLHLKRQCKKGKGGSDTFLWSSQLLGLLAGNKKLRRGKAFLTNMGALAARLANCDGVSRAAAQLVTCGELLAFHKVDQLQQLENAEKGLQPSIRPINIGVCLLKWAMQLAIAHTSVTQQTKRMVSIQLGLAPSRGNEILAHFLWASYLDNQAVLLTDFKNAFNEVTRDGENGMLQQFAARVPSLVLLFNTYYGIAAFCFYYIEGRTTEVILSFTGARMGCGGGSLAFDVTVHPIYEAVNALPSENRRDRPARLRATTDDAPITIAIPDADIILQDTADDFYTRVHELFETYCELASTIGLTPNLSKCKLLVPPQLPNPSKEILKKLRFELVRDGVTNVGGPLGTKAYVDSFFNKLVFRTRARMSDLDGNTPR